MDITPEIRSLMLTKRVNSYWRFSNICLQFQGQVDSILDTGLFVYSSANLKIMFKKIIGF
jgi:hypothetical protein